MTVILPSPVPLDPPSGDPDALDEAFRGAATAAAWLAPLAEELGAAPLCAPGWQGLDATAAGESVGRVAGFTRELAVAVLRGAGRLSAHGRVLEEARREIGRLVAEQDEDFRVAWQRLLHLDGVDLSAAAPPAAQAVLDELAATERARRVRHAALLDDVRADALDTARVLRECSSLVGGTGRAGDAGRVVAHLAEVLPEWGRQELAFLGRDLARDLFDGPITPEVIEALTGGAAAYAGSEAFADSFLQAAGPDGVRYLLLTLGMDRLGPTNSLAGLLARVLGAAASRGPAGEELAGVLGAEYVRPDDGDGDLVVAGMATVLAAWRTAGGARLDTVAEWGRQILRRERKTRVEAGAVLPAEWAPAVGDPADMVLQLLAGSTDPAPAAALLGDRSVWSAVLARHWIVPHDLVRVIALAGAEPGVAGDTVTRSGLEALATGLSDGGDPDHWTVDRDTAAVITPALGAAAAAHVGVVAAALVDGADAWTTGSIVDVVRGLGYLTIDPMVAANLEGALADWAGSQPVAADTARPAAPLPAVAVPAAFVAVREYGRKLGDTVDAYRRKQAAEWRAWGWTITVGTLAELAGGPWAAGAAVTIANGYAAIYVGADGTWENVPDERPPFDEEHAVVAARQALAAEVVVDREAFRLQATAAYADTSRLLGEPVPPVSPARDLLGPLVSAFIPAPEDVLLGAFHTIRGGLPLR